MRVLGADPARGERALRDRIGIVLQAGGLQPDLTVAEVLEMYGRCYQRPRPVDELIELVELADKRDARVRTLSGGQQRRLDLALGLVGDPELLFLDEPTTGFDPARPPAGVVDDPLALRARQDGRPHHPLHGRGAGPGRPRRGDGRGQDHRPRAARASSAGRDALPAEIRFRVPETVRAARASRRVTRDGQSVLVRTPEPVAVTHRLTGWALETGVALDGFAVAQPSLEDIYLELTT